MRKGDSNLKILVFSLVTQYLVLRSKLQTITTEKYTPTCSSLPSMNEITVVGVNLGPEVHDKGRKHSVRERPSSGS